MYQNFWDTWIPDSYGSISMMQYGNILIYSKYYVMLNHIA